MWEGLLALAIGSFSGSGIVAVVTKIGLKYCASLVFVLLRFLFATFIFFPIFLFTKRKKLQVKDFIPLAILAFFLFINVTLFTVGVQFTSVLMSQVLYLPTPIVVSILAHFFLREQLTKQKIIGLFIALTGVCLLLFQSIIAGTSLTFGKPLGNSFIIVAMLGYSGWILYSRILARGEKYNSYQTSFFTFFFISCYLLLLLPFQQHLSPSSVQWIFPKGLLFAVCVAIASIFQYFFLQLGIKKTNAFTASLFQYVGPFFAGALSIPLLHEKISLFFVIGGVLILFGVFYATTYSLLLKIRNSRVPIRAKILERPE